MKAQAIASFALASTIASDFPNASFFPLVFALLNFIHMSVNPTGDLIGIHWGRGGGEVGGGGGEQEREDSAREKDWRRGRFLALPARVVLAPVVGARAGCWCSRWLLLLARWFLASRWFWRRVVGQL
jgi:hypothetical protein